MSSPPPALYSHVIECVLSFLSLNELAIAMRVSPLWLQASCRMSSLRATIVEGYKECPAWLPVSSSRCARHVKSIYSTSGRVPMNDTMLQTITRGCVNLEQLQLVLTSMPPAVDQLLFPRNLLELSIALPTPLGMDGLCITSVLAQICSQAPRLETLGISLPTLTPQVSFGSLQSLPHLSILTIDWRGSDSLVSDAQVDSIRALPNLHQALIGRSSTDLLRRLLRRPHDLRWQRLSYRWGHLSEQHAELVNWLPSQTALHIKHCRVRNLKAFPLPNLQSLTIAATRGPEPDAPQLLAPLAAAIRPSTQLTALHLIDCHFGDGDLALILAQTPQLRSLSITTPRHFVSLASLSADPSRCPKLQILSLAQCTSLLVSELRYLALLPALQELELRDSLSGPLDADTHSRLVPPSSLIPSLTKLSYQYRPENLVEHKRWIATLD